MKHLRNPRSTTSPGTGIASRYRALLMTHASVNERLMIESSRPRPDFEVIQRLKRRKLRINDELATLDRIVADPKSAYGRHVFDPATVGFPKVEKSTRRWSSAHGTDPATGVGRTKRVGILGKS